MFSRIYCICHHSTKLREVITRDLLPSSTMIKDLSQEFGLPISQEELTDRKFAATSPLSASNLEDFQGRNPTLTSEILAHQEKYLQWQDTGMLKNKGQKHSLMQVGILSSPGAEVPGFCPTWAVQSPGGRYRADGQFLSRASPLACIYSPALGS